MNHPKDRPKRSPFKIGELIYHNSFGVCEVISWDNKTGITTANYIYMGYTIPVDINYNSKFREATPVEIAKWRIEKEKLNAKID